MFDRSDPFPSRPRVLLHSIRAGGRVRHRLLPKVAKGSQSLNKQRAETRPVCRKGSELLWDLWCAWFDGTGIIRSYILYHVMLSRPIFDRSDPFPSRPRALLQSIKAGRRVRHRLLPKVADGVPVPEKNSGAETKPVCRKGSELLWYLWCTWLGGTGFIRSYIRYNDLC